MEKYKAGYKKQYWFVDHSNGTAVVAKDVNTFSLKHISRFTLGNMFPSEEAALASLRGTVGVNTANA